MPSHARLWRAAVFVAACMAGRVALPDEPAKLTEEQRNGLLAVRDQLQKEAEELDAKGNRAGAIVAAQKLVAIQDRVFGDDDGNADWRGWIAKRYEQLENFPAAKLARQEALDIKTRLWGKNHWEVAAARLALQNLELLAALTAAERSQLALADTRNRDAVRLYDEGKYPDALQAGAEAAEIRERLLGKAHPDYAQSLSDLAFLYELKREYPKAEPLYLQALEIRKKALGEMHPEYARSLSNLGSVYKSMRDFAKAEPLFLQALEIRKKALGEMHLEYARSLSNLGSVYKSMGDFAKAEPLFLQALEIRKKTLGELHADHADYESSLRNLAFLYESMGNYSKAEPLFVQALEIDRKVLGESHPNYAMSLIDLALLYESMREYPKAEPLYLQALEIRKKAFGESHPDYVASLSDLALLYESMREYPKAEPLYLQALEIRKKTLGELHADYERSLRSLAFLYKSMGKYAKSEPLFVQALEIDRKVLGEDHPDYATRLSNLSVLYDNMGDYARAEPLARQALEITKKARGEDHPDYAIRLSNLSVLYDNMGDYARAEPLARQALEITKKATGEFHSDYAIRLSNLSVLYLHMVDYVRAEPLARQALEITKKATGEDHPDYATRLSNLSVLYDNMGDYARAEPLARQALEITKKARGEDHPDYAIRLSNLSVLYDNMGDYARAEPLARQALEITKKARGEFHSDYAIRLSNLCVLYQHVGDYARAEPLARQALEITKKATGEDHSDYATRLNNLAALYQSMGDYRRAEPLYVRAMEIWKNSPGESHPLYALSLQNLAVLYSSMGDYARAERYYRQASEVYKKALGEMHPAYAKTLANLAELYSRMGDDSRAEPLFAQSLHIRKKVLGENHPEYASSLIDLAALYESTGDYVQAESFYRQALEIKKKALGEEHPDYASSVSLLAGLYRSKRDYARAEPLYQHAREIRKKALGETHPAYATSVSNLGMLNEAMGRYVEAESLYRQALDIERKALGEGNPEYASSLNLLAEFYQSMGDLAKAEPLFREALRVNRKNLDLASVVQSERQQLAMLSDVRHQLDSFVALAAGESKYSNEVFEEVLAWKGLVLQRQRAIRAAADQPDAAPILEELRTTATRLAALSFAAPAPSQAEAWKSQVGDLSRRKEDLEVKLAAVSDEYRAARTSGTLGELQAALPEGGALVDFLEYRHLQHNSQALGGGWQREQRLVAFVVRRGRPVEAVGLGAIEPIKRTIDAWRKDTGQSPDSRLAAEFLRQNLWAPIEKHLADAKTVLISPDGELGKLPFAALPGKQSGTYLLEDYTLAVIPASQEVIDLARARPRRRQAKNLLVVADVNYDSRANPTDDKPKKLFAQRAARDDSVEPFVPLSGTRGESATIQKLYRDNFGAQGMTSLESAAASKAAFVREAPRHLYLHMATHGYFASSRFQSALERTVFDARSEETQVTSSGALSVVPRAPLVAGIGAELTVSDEMPIVSRLIEGGAAAMEGRISVGDTILGIAEAEGEFVETKGKALDDVIALIRGVPGSQVRLRVKKIAAGDIQTYELVRRDISALISPPNQFRTMTHQSIGGYHPGLLSGLALAGANQPSDDDDGILTAEEVGSLNLSGSELVVLSACETGLGKAAGGEGLLGLQRAFQVAGARTVIASLWKVDDVATRDLMERFYDNLWNKNMGKLEALREAQLWMLKERGPRGLKDAEEKGAGEKRLPPYFWAAFVLSGDWR